MKHFLLIPALFISMAFRAQENDTTEVMPYLFTACKDTTTINSTKFIMPPSDDFYLIENFEKMIPLLFSVEEYDVLVSHFNDQGPIIDHVWVEIYDRMYEEIAFVPFCILEEVYGEIDLVYEYDQLFDFIYRRQGITPPERVRGYRDSR
ncbi:MAG: hypothetical protein ACK44B_07450 [Flavobacteriales bacterium]|jgi:hypothetical protein